MGQNVFLIVDAGEARELAQRILSDVRLYAGDVSEARALFQSKVSPSLHAVFEEALANPGAAESPPGRKLTTLVGVAFFALLAGVSWFAYQRVLGPGRQRLVQALAGWIGEAQSGRGQAPAHTGATTAAALVAISASTANRITHDTGSFAFSGAGDTCFELELTGPNGVTPVTVRISEEAGVTQVTHVGLRPPCACARNGRTTSCE